MTLHDIFPTVGYDSFPRQYTELQVGTLHGQTTSIAVPSRLLSPGEVIRPLSGWRIAVKDIFHIKGTRTSACNRAYRALYPPASKTAACIEVLEEAGAVVIGTTKLASFAAAEEPLECIDFQAPWNPRGDGYQSPAGSSSGSGVAVASYLWVDISIGSDSEYCSKVDVMQSFSKLICHEQLVAAAAGRVIGTVASRCGPLMGCFLLKDSS